MKMQEELEAMILAAHVALTDWMPVEREVLVLENHARDIMKMIESRLMSERVVHAACEDLFPLRANAIERYSYVDKESTGLMEQRAHDETRRSLAIAWREMGG